MASSSGVSIFDTPDDMLLLRHTPLRSLAHPNKTQKQKQKSKTI
jgi:hypothetical protein